MNNNQETFCRRITASIKLVLAIGAAGLCGQVALGQNLIVNGDFSDGLNDWKTEGDVTSGTNQAILKESGVDPLLYQAVAANGYAYELRFDVDLFGLSDRAGSGEFDSVSLVLYEGASPDNLTPDSASEKRILIQGNASGLTALVENAQIAENPVLGIGYLSVVVEITSDYQAVAPGVELFNSNGLVDSEIRISNVRLIEVDRGRLANISNRGAVGTGPNRMIASFVLSGPDNKSVVVRGAGPWLAGFGVPGTLEDPAEELKDFQTGAVISANDDWEIGNNKQELIDAMAKVGAAPFAEGSKDSALFQNEGGGLEEGQYSVVVAGQGENPTGIGIAEIYDYNVDFDGATELINISNRGNTSKGSGAQIPGFVITGDRGRVVLIRVVGPSLAAFVNGTLDDPLLILTQNIAGTNHEVARNDDYYLAENADQIVATAARIGAFALLPDEKDSAILIGLEPGVYTAQAQVKTDGDSGIVLVEVYVVADNTRPEAATHVVFVSTAGTTVLPMDEILDPDQDGEGDILSIASYGQPGKGSVDLNEDGELEFTNEIGFVGQTMFSYTLTDGEFESAPGIIGLNVAPPNAKIWSGEGASGNFSDPANWAGGEVPGPSDDVWIVPQGATTITLNQDAHLQSLRIGGIGSDVTFKHPYGRTLKTNGETFVGYGSTLELSSGTIETGGNLIVAGNLKWTSGTMKGDATTIIEVGGVAEFLSGQLGLEDNRDFLNRGKVIQSGNSYLYARNASNSVITNAAMAQWDVSSPSGRFAYTDGTGAQLLFNNAGDLYKSAITGNVTYGYTTRPSSFTNQATGRVMVEGGSLTFEGSGQGLHSGELMIADGSEAIFAYGMHTFNSGSTISDTGTLTVGTNSNVAIASAQALESLKVTNGGTLNHSGTLTVNEYEQSGGTLSSDDALVVTGTLTWSGGIQDGEGTTLLENGATGTLNSTTLTLNGNRAFTNHGELDQLSNALLYPAGGSQSVVTNADDGIWNLNLANNRDLGYADASSRFDFVNAGTLNKQDNLHVYDIGYNSGIGNFTNTGTVNVPSGTLRFDITGAGTQDGEIVISSDAEVIFTRGTHTFGEDAAISDTGTLTIDGVAALSMPNALTLESLKMSNGTLTAGDAITVGTFVQSRGTFVSSSDLIVTDTLTVTGGTQSGDGVTILEAEGEGTMSAARWVFSDSRDFTNRGTFTLSGNAGFDGRTGSQTTITNAEDATMTSNMPNGQYIIFSGDTSTTTNFVNEGTLTKTNLVGINYIGYYSYVTNFTNTSTGTINVSGGTLQLWGGGSSSHSGNLTIAEDSEVYFQVGTHTFLSGATVTDSGTLHIGTSTVSIAEALTIPHLKLSANNGSLTVGGALTVETLEISAGTLNPGDASTVGTLVQSGGIFDSSSDLIVTDTLTVTGGTQNGDGVTILDIGGEGTMSGGRWIFTGNRSFTNRGMFTLSGNTSFQARSGGQTTITNAADATMISNLANGQYIIYSNDASTVTNFVNEGTLTKANLAGNNYIGYSSYVTNFTNTASGTVNVSVGTLQFWGDGSSSYSGTLAMTENAEVYFQSGTHNFLSGATLANSGTLHLGASTVAIAEGLTIPNLILDGSNGELTVGGAISVNTFTQTRGTLIGNADMVVAESADLSGGAQGGSGTTIFDTGSTVSHTAVVYLEGGRNIENRGDYDLTGSGHFSARGGFDASTVTNGSGATWTVTSNRLVNNDGSSDITFVNDGSLTKTSTNSTSFGTSSGTSTFTNNGTFEAQAGSFVLGNTSTANFAGGSTLRLTTAGGTTRVVDGTGTINFGGTLEVLLAVGFVPANAETITLLDFGRDKGAGTFDGYVAPNGYSSIVPTYNTSLNPGNLEITFNQ